MSCFDLLYIPMNPSMTDLHVSLEMESCRKGLVRNRFNNEKKEVPPRSDNPSEASHG